MNQPAIDNPRPPDSVAGSDELRARSGTLHLTASILIGHEEVRHALDALDRNLRDGQPKGSPGPRWDGPRPVRIPRELSKNALSEAIEPLFDDIADRRRGLFIEDYLINTANLAPGDGYGPNVRDVVDITIPERISWSTEGKNLGTQLDTPLVLRKVRCRSFWVAHSNSSLTYHLSWELPYQHDGAHYYALSLLQKVFSATEGTAFMYDDRQESPFVSSHYDVDDVHRRLHDYFRHRFQLDATELFANVARTTRVTPAESLGAAELTSILLDKGPKPTSLRDWKHKCVWILEDPYFFGLLNGAARTQLTRIDDVPATAMADSTLFYSKQALADADPDALAYYFLSGFFQNIIDFLRQDLSEVQDGTDPIYPPSTIPDDSSYSKVYATHTSLYQVVAQSRSLHIGRDWIGTCPYLFFVHLMTFHNEDLLDRYEHNVRLLVDHLTSVKLLDNDNGAGRLPRNWRSNETFVRFRGFRLNTFEEIYRHRYVNILRYNTESEFYEAIEEVRGIRKREHYWAEVVTELEKAADDLRSAQQHRIDGRRNELLAAVTIIGILQVAFQVLNYFFTSNFKELEWAAALTVIAVALAGLVVLYWRRGER